LQISSAGISLSGSLQPEYLYSFPTSFSSTVSTLKHRIASCSWRSTNGSAAILKVGDVG